jgi:cation diffusion facilitator CzcD-associated flavoprotein CzcO
MNDRNAPVCIIGAGPGGLLAAVSLKKRDIPFQIVDAGRQVGGIWDIDRDETPMYESAHFISSRTLAGFPASRCPCSPLASLGPLDFLSVAFSSSAG